jgi:hypothetical protein
MQSIALIQQGAVAVEQVFRLYPGRQVWAVEKIVTKADTSYVPVVRMIRFVAKDFAVLDDESTVPHGPQGWIGVFPNTSTGYADCLLWCDNLARWRSMQRYVQAHNWKGPNFPSEDPEVT